MLYYFSIVIFSAADGMSDKSSNKGGRQEAYNLI